MYQILKTLFLSTLTILIAICLITFPNQSLDASIQGLTIWWKIVFPSLLPFFIISELLIAFGVVNFIGVLFEPIMRPLFRVPGAGSFGWIMGMASGYPTGAKIAVRLREQNQVTKYEAERLVAFTNASSPLFIFGAISIGFFKDAKLGLLFAVAHYIANIFVGICMRFSSTDEPIRIQTNSRYNKKEQIFIRALREMHRERLREKRPLGEIASDAVINSIKTLVMVGGFIVLFSVLTKILFLLNISKILAFILNILLMILAIPSEFALPMVSGFFEITLGIQQIAEFSQTHFLLSLVVTSFVLGFNGLSVQSQVASIIAKTDIRFFPYLIGRVLHGTFAAILTIILYKPLYINRLIAKDSETHVHHSLQLSNNGNLFDILNDYGPIITLISLSLCILLILRRNRLNK